MTTISRIDKNSRWQPYDRTPVGLVIFATIIVAFGCLPPRSPNQPVRIDDSCHPHQKGCSENVTHETLPEAFVKVGDERERINIAETATLGASDSSAKDTAEMTPAVVGADVAARSIEPTLPISTYVNVEDQVRHHGNGLASSYSKLLPYQCRDGIRKRKIAVRPAGMPALGVATPLRIAGPLGRVRFVTPGLKSVYGIVDCRLILLLDDVSERLSTLSVVEVYVDNFYRPKAHLPGKKSPSQHAFGLAIDIAGFGLSDGTVLNVERDFNGVLGEPVCGARAGFSERTRSSVLLRNIVCELAQMQAFNYLLTPNHDAAHHNHLHGDIKRNSLDYVVR